ncbi:hypothetical protein GC163_18320 [bacterium]|nr:hypothetical protein [bacterium]
MLPTVAIWNPSAGGTAQAETIYAELSQRNDCRVIATGSREETLVTTATTVQAGVRRLIAAGGDGTVSAVLQGVADSGLMSEVTCGILPLGTGNDLARTLKMPLDPQQALEVLLQAQDVTAACDLMELKAGGVSRVMANMCTAGNTGQYLSLMTPEMKQRWGAFCYLRGVIQAAADLQGFEVHLSFDGDPPQKFSVLNLFVANGQTTGAGMTIAPQAELGDGLMDVIAILDGTTTQIASLTANYLLDQFLEHPLVFYRRARLLGVECTDSFPVTIDGDVVTDQPFQISVLPQRLQMITGG